jgi:hypothetical protein
MMSSVPKVERWDGGSDSVAGQVTPRLGRVARGEWGRVPAGGMARLSLPGVNDPLPESTLP